MYLDEMECDICFETNGKTVNDIKCCLGKKWCTDCELTINLEMTVKCPFCRKVISNTIQLPLLHLYNTSHGTFMPEVALPYRNVRINIQYVNIEDE